MIHMTIMPIKIIDFTFCKCSNVYFSKADLIWGLIIVLVLEPAPLVKNDALCQE